jgi:hypothetical protein
MGAVPIAPTDSSPIALNFALLCSRSGGAGPESLAAVLFSLADHLQELLGLLLRDVGRLGFTGLLLTFLLLGLGLLLAGFLLRLLTFALLLLRAFSLLILFLLPGF